MPIYKLEDSKIIPLPETSFITEKINEARDLQKFIINSIETIEKNLYVISSEFGDWEDSNRRIDILCIDKQANLVVVELKRTEDGGHMELQAIRYAAMVANMTFEKAIEVHQKYLDKNNIQTIAKEAILHFLQWDSEIDGSFAGDVRIILVSQDFKKEITTSVLWLLERKIDIKCIRIKPQRDGTNLYFDIQQIIPLPETADYQVKLREKVTEQREARNIGTRDYSKYNIEIPPFSESGLNKRKTIIFTINKTYNAGISPIELMQVTGSSRWIWVNSEVNTRKDFEAMPIENTKNYDASRWFNEDQELMQHAGKTYAFTNQHGGEMLNVIREIFNKFPNLNGTIYKVEN